MNYRELIKDKKKIVVKIGSSSITHESTGNINYRKLEKLVRILCDIKNQGKDVVLVSSGAIAVGRQTVGIKRSNVLAEKQACAAIGQCRLMMTYQKLFQNIIRLLHRFCLQSIPCRIMKALLMQKYF